MNIFPPFLYISVIGAIVLLRISFWGKKRGWYKKKGNWFSRTMHFFGGFLVAMFWSGFIRYFPLIITFTFLVGVFWEIVEYFYGIYKLKKFGTREGMIETRDTIEDLICDVTGSIIWVLILIL